MVSVIVPIYNASAFLRTCLNSIVRQTYSDLEIILVDDGSTDDSLEICKAFAECDHRIRIIHKENAGCLEARRTGLQAATGEHIVFVDSDDYLPPKAIGTMMKYGANAPDSLVIGSYHKIYKKIPYKTVSACNNLSSPMEVKHKEFIDQYYCSWFGVSNVPVSLCAKCFPIDVIKHAYEKVKPEAISFWGEDFIITIDIAPRIESVFFLPDVVYNYRIGVGGTAKYRESMLSDFENLYQRKLPYAEQYVMPQDIQYLCDVEMCNVIRSYLLQQKELAGFSKGQIRDSIQTILERPIIQRVLTNPRLKSTKSPFVMNLISKDYDSIVAEIFSKKPLKTRVRSFAVKIIDSL